MSQMPKKGAFLASYANETGAVIADTYRWDEKGELEKFEYLGKGKHEWKIVPKGLIHEMESNPLVEYRHHQE